MSMYPRLRSVEGRQRALLPRRPFAVHILTQYLLVLLLFVQVSLQQEDPLNDFCRRFGHQSAIVDSKLYIDGGLVDWDPIADYPSNYSNPFLLYNDLTSVSDGGEPQLHANLSKNGTIPNLVGGTLWPDTVNKRFYLFGGEYFQTPPVDFKLLSYDILYDTWDSFGPPSNPINSSSWGAGVAVPERGEGYYYGGWVSNVTTPGWTGDPLAVNSLVKYDMDSNLWTTNMGPDSVPRAEGVMVYLPASDRGLLIYFGGITQPYGNSTTVGSPMDTIFIYDIASSQWYDQTASGDVPEMRRRFCAGATWAPDRSSYNIYLYGGAGLAPNTTGFDDVYILTLPSFTWIKWYPTAPGVGKPHNSMTCNVVDGAQMLIIGGTFPLTDACDAQNVWGTHSLDLGKQNPDGALWYGYRSNLTSYVVPEEIISKVGGSSLGGATVTAPATWLNRDLPVYFTRNASNPVRTPTRVITTSTPSSTSTSTPSSTSTSSASATPAPSSPSLSTGAIIGVAVGGAALLLLFSLAIFCLCRHRRRNTIRDNTPYLPPPTATTINDGPYNHYYPSPPRPPPSELQNTPHELSSDVTTYPLSHSNTQHVIVEPKYDSASSLALRGGSPPGQDQVGFQQKQQQAGGYGLWPQPHSSPALSSPTSLASHGQGHSQNQYHASQVQPPQYPHQQQYFPYPSPTTLPTPVTTGSRSASASDLVRKPVTPGSQGMERTYSWR